MRDSVEWFAHKMEAKLLENDYKGGWDDCSSNHLLSELRNETGELSRMIVRGSPDDVIDEAVDVANFAMMIANKAWKARQT